MPLVVKKAFWLLDQDWDGVPDSEEGVSNTGDSGGLSPYAIDFTPRHVPSIVRPVHSKIKHSVDLKVYVDITTSTKTPSSLEYPVDKSGEHGINTRSDVDFELDLATRLNTLKSTMHGSHVSLQSNANCINESKVLISLDAAIGMHVKDRIEGFVPLDTRIRHTGFYPEDDDLLALIAICLEEEFI